MNCGVSVAPQGANTTLGSSGGNTPQAIVVKQGGNGWAVVFIVVVVGCALFLALLGSGILKKQQDWLGRDKPIVEVRADDKHISGSLNLPTVNKPQQPATQSQPNPPPSYAPPAYVEQPTPASPQNPPAYNESTSGKAFTVPARAASWAVITVPFGGNRHLQGTFTARGGSGNDIEVLIGDENVANGHQGMVWYDSGKVTTGKIDLVLAPGTYYLIFNNRFSFLTPKTLYSDIQIR